MDELAEEAIVDVDGDGDRDYADVLQWSQMKTDFPYPGDKLFLSRASFAIAFGLDNDITALNADNLLGRADWRPALESGAYADRLVSCASPILLRDLCQFRDLPLIGQETSRPEHADIMERVVVTHNWMRERFSQVLRRVPADLLLMFRSVSAIIIGDDVRPSYFDGASASMFLDAGTLWVTRDELADVNQEPDYRLDFASQVNFADNWRYVNNNRPAFGELDESGNANIDDVSALMASLLFHELAHAADFISPEEIGGLTADESPYDLVFRSRSEELVATDPLQAVELFGVANVLFGGATATSQQGGLHRQGDRCPVRAGRCQRPLCLLHPVGGLRHAV